jgi:hypothetical protein
LRRRLFFAFSQFLFTDLVKYYLIAELRSVGNLWLTSSFGVLLDTGAA